MTKNPYQAQPKPGQPGQYFQEKKKGQMNQLKNLLSKVINEQDSKKGRQVVRKVIGYMTLGMDASPVFSEMCRASFLNDEVMKKMIYFYLTTYAEDNPDLTIMAINTFQKQCKHSSSKIRGLALRNLCSFKSADYVNNVLPTIRDLLSDFEPYVKKTAIMGLLKVFYYDPETIYGDENIISTLSSLIRDQDSLVSCNAIVALDQILISEGGIPLTAKLVKYLYNRLKQYNEWEQAQVLQILYKYTPQSEPEHYEIMSILWDKLKQSSTPMVLGSVRIIIKLAKEKEDLFKKVVEKIKAPLLTLMCSKQTTASFETAYIILEHIEYVIRHMNGKSSYQTDFKYFYCRVDEPTYIKQIKVKILGLLANQHNLGDMLNQLTEYVNSTDIEIARKSVQTLADISTSLPTVSEALMVNLISFYKSEKEHLVNESVKAFYKVLKRQPRLFSKLKPDLLKGKNLIKESEAIKSFIWILGTFAPQIDASPYLLQEYLQNQQEFNALSDNIKSVLLTQIIQTFLKRAPETHKILAKIFKYILNNESTSMYLKDHASFYYRALKDNVEEVRKNFNIVQTNVSKGKEEKQEANAENDFNNLCLVYKKKQNKFIKNYEYFISMRNKELGLEQPDNLQQEENMIENSENNEQLNIDFSQKNQNSKAEVNWEIPLEASDLQQDVGLTSDEFQQIWTNFEAYEEKEYKILNDEQQTEDSIQELLKMWSLFTMASACDEQENILRFFIYGKHVTQRIICTELTINKGQKIIGIITKAPETQLAHNVNEYIQELLRMNEFIQ